MIKRCDNGARARAAVAVSLSFDSLHPSLKLTAAGSAVSIRPRRCRPCAPTPGGGSYAAAMMRGNICWRRTRLFDRSSVRLAKGSAPASSAYIMTPHDQMSAFLQSYWSLRRT